MTIICPKTNRICESTGCTKENNCMTPHTHFNEEWNEGDKFTTPETGDTVFTVNKVLTHDVEARDGRSASGTTSFAKHYIQKVASTQPPSNSGDKNLTAMGEMIEYCKEQQEISFKLNDGGGLVAFTLAEKKATSLLAKEKQQIMEWISVEDGLPDESMGRVLCWCEEINNLGTSHFFWNCSYSKLHGFTDNLKTYHVTHWKEVHPPTPKPLTKNIN